MAMVTSDNAKRAGTRHSVDQMPCYHADLLTNVLGIKIWTVLLCKCCYGIYSRLHTKR